MKKAIAFIHLWRYFIFWIIDIRFCHITFLRLCFQANNRAEKLTRDDKTKNVG